MINKNFIFFTFIFFYTAFFSYSQEILTANNYLAGISENYAGVEDYEADITIVRGATVMSGVLSYKSPDMLLINFSDPEEQVFSLYDNRLVIYIPRYRVAMSQKVDRKNQIAGGAGAAGGASLASREGLLLLKRNYSVAYLESPNPVPLDSEAEDSEQVIKLKFVWRSTQEGFRQIDLSVGEDGYIRRFVGYTAENEEIQFDFRNVNVNQNIPEARFDYDPPPTANVFENFLFDPQS